MRITDSAYITSVKDVVFRPALEAFEAAMLPASEKKATGALAYVKRKEAECDANADLGIGRTQDVASVTWRGHERSLRFVKCGVAGDVFACCGIRITKMGQHIADVAIGGRGMSKVSVCQHVLGLDACDGRKRRVDGQRGQIVPTAIRIQQISCFFLLR